MNLHLTATLDPEHVKLLYEVLSQTSYTYRRLAALETKVDALMTVTQEVRDLVVRLDAATNAIAARLQSLADQLTGDITAADAATIKADLEAEVARLETMGTNPADPIPEAPPVGP